MKRLFNILFFLLLCFVTSAQDNKIQQRYNEALRHYDNGEFEMCQQIARPLAKETTEMMKTSTFRLLALCRLALDDIDGARDYVEQMLKNDPYFTPSLGDPQRFIDLINESKNQEAGITTASRQAESINEAPVAVTLITEDMIRYSGSQNLQELLCLYVPGMTEAEGMETNIAMHGIYSLSQDKILIMVDGHRLNSSSTNSEGLDYRSSLDKIKQIEILRGPAASLYGNVALTAVVNIITRKGAQMNGGRITGIFGTQDTNGGSFIVGGGNNVVDIMGWGSIMYSKGFKYEVDNGLTGTDHGTTTLYTNGFRGDPSYDIGIKGRWKDFTMSINLQRSKKVPYINIIQVPADQSPETVIVENEPNFNSYRNFTYDKYPNVDGYYPGVTRSNNRINLDYSHSFANFDISAAGFINFESTNIYNALGDSINHGVATALISLLQQTDPEAGDAGNEFSKMIAGIGDSEQVPTKGAYEMMGWRGITYGLQGQGLTNYNFLGHGNIIFGIQLENFALSSSSFFFGGNFTGAGSVSSNAICKEGNEMSISSYLQLKHFIPSEKVIFNAGIRYDHKSRFNNSKIDKFSPRFSVIWRLTNKMSLRGNYNFSFVDAPYIYRASILKIFGGSSDMQPETMHNFTTGLTYYNQQTHFSAEVEGFYNILNDLCILNISDLVAWSGEEIMFHYLFKNAGKVRTFGIDAAVQYNQPRFFTNFNATWQRVASYERYMVYNNETYSTPAFHANLTLAGAAYVGHGSGFFDGGKLWLRSTVQFQTETYYPTMDLYSSVVSNIMEEQYQAVEFTSVPTQCNIGLGVSYDWKHVNIDLTLKNLFNNNYKIGSMLQDGIPRAGRQFLAKITWIF